MTYDDFKAYQASLAAKGPRYQAVGDMIACAVGDEGDPERGIWHLIWTGGELRAGTNGTHRAETGDAALALWKEHCDVPAPPAAPPAAPVSLIHPHLNVLNFRDADVRRFYTVAAQTDYTQLVDFLFFTVPKYLRTGEEFTLDAPHLGRIIDNLILMPLGQLRRLQPRLVVTLEAWWQDAYLKNGGFQLFLFYNLPEILRQFKRCLVDPDVEAFRTAYYHVKKNDVGLVVADWGESTRQSLRPSLFRVYPEKLRRRFPQLTFPKAAELGPLLVRLGSADMLSILSNVIKRQLQSENRRYYVIADGPIADPKGAVIYSEYYEVLEELGDTAAIRTAFTDLERAKILIELE